MNLQKQMKYLKKHSLVQANNNHPKQKRNALNNTGHFLQMNDLLLIQTWLDSNREYAIGYEIYRRLGKNNFLKDILADGEDEWNAETLLNELADLAQELAQFASSVAPAPAHVAANVAQSSPSAKVEQILAEERKAASDRADAPETIKEAIKRRKYLYASSRDAHSKLKVLSTIDTAEAKEQRHALAVKILNSFDEIKTLWDLTNYYDTYRKLPVQPQELKTDLATLDIATLNQDWLIDYKYILKFRNDTKKRTRVLERISLCTEREKILRLKDAFIHGNLTIPAITGE